MKKENISDAVIRRLPRYYRQLTDLCARGVIRISSHSLGQEMNITASQIRQDFSCFGEFGQQGYGYNVEELRAEIGHILGVDNDHHLIMIGVGNLGHALLQNFHFAIQELGLYLDTHPNDMEALDLFNEYVEQYSAAMQQYEQKHGPMNQMAAGLNGRYEWTDGPWPWEFEANKEG